MSLNQEKDEDPLYTWKEVVDQQPPHRNQNVARYQINAKIDVYTLLAVICEQYHLGEKRDPPPLMQTLKETTLDQTGGDLT